MYKLAKVFSALVIAASLTACAPAPVDVSETPPSSTYSLIGKITVKEGTRAEFIGLLSGVLGDSNCISCQILPDKSDSNALWVSETWPNEAAHDDALKTPKALIALKKGRPMIVKMERMADNG